MPALSKGLSETQDEGKGKEGSLRLFEGEYLATIDLAAPLANRTTSPRTTRALTSPVSPIKASQKQKPLQRGHARSRSNSPRPAAAFGRSPRSSANATVARASTTPRGAGRSRSPRSRANVTAPRASTTPRGHVRRTPRGQQESKATAPDWYVLFNHSSFSALYRYPITCAFDKNTGCLQPPTA